MTDILIFLDLTKMDDILLNQLSSMDETLNLGKICAAHYLPLQDIDNLAEQFDLDQPIEDILREELTEKVSAHHWDTSRYEIKIFSTGGFSEMIRWINESDYQICMLGKKAFLKGSGIFSGKLVRMVDTSVLFASELSRPVTEKILVPVDFSENSRKALRMSEDITEELRCELSAVHVFRLNESYFPYLGESTARVIKKMSKEKQAGLEKFIAKNLPARPVKTEVIAAKNTNIGDEIYKYAKSHFSDLIIVGIKGKTDDDMLLIGAVAQYLIRSDKEISVLIVR